MKPVPARDAVASPVVKIFMSDHAFNVGVIDVGGGSGVGQYVFRIENIEAFVFHRAHVEVAGSHDHETLQVKRQSKTRFVPSNRGHEGVHRVFGFIQITRAHIHLKHMVFASE